MVLDGLVVSVLSILVGLYVGLLRGGLIRNLSLARVEWWGLLSVGIVLPVIVSRLDLGAGVLLIVVAFGSLIAFARRNRHLLGMGIVALGVCANLAVVVVNNGMPVRASALVDAGLAESHEVDRVEISGVQRLERDDDALMFLADIIPLAATEQVLSVGDVLMLVGLGTVASNLLRNRTRTRTSSKPVRDRAALAARSHTRSSESPRRERQIPDFEPIRLDDEPLHLDRELVGATSIER